MTLTRSPSSCALLATPRRTDRSTAAYPGGRDVIGAVAALLGFPPLMRWQRSTLATALELGDDGLLVHPGALLSVPRQNGKSTLLDVLQVVRAITRRRQRIAYTCQQRHEGAQRLVAIGELLQPRFVAKVARTTGAERLVWRGTSSSQRIITAGPNAGRGPSLDLAVVDEAAVVHPATVGAIEPTQSARPDPQLWQASNAGPHRSGTFWSRLEVARPLAGDPDCRVAVFEYGLGDDDDPDDPAAWVQRLPAVAEGVVSVRFLRDKRDGCGDDPVAIAAFRREYLNLWPRAAGDPRFVAAWARLERPELGVPDPIGFALEVDYDRAWSTIAVAGGVGPRVVDVIDRRPGTAWVAARLADLVERHDPIGVAVDRGGPAAALVPDLDPVVDVRLVDTREVAAAAGAFYDDVLEGRVVHRGHPELTAAVDRARRARAGGAWLFDRGQTADADASALVAAVLASWVVADDLR